jgi:hypothetical protein
LEAILAARLAPPAATPGLGMGMMSKGLIQSGKFPQNRL